MRRILATIAIAVLIPQIAFADFLDIYGNTYDTANRTDKQMETSGVSGRRWYGSSFVVPNDFSGAAFTVWIKPDGYDNRTWNLLIGDGTNTTCALNTVIYNEQIHTGAGITGDWLPTVQNVYNPITFDLASTSWNWAEDMEAHLQFQTGHQYCFELSLSAESGGQSYVAGNTQNWSTISTYYYKPEDGVKRSEDADLGFQLSGYWTGNQIFGTNSSTYIPFSSLLASTSMGVQENLYEKCDTMNAFVGAFCDSMVFLFVPNNASIDKYSDLVPVLESRVGFAYWYDFADEASNLSSVSEVLEFNGEGTAIGNVVLLDTSETKTTLETLLGSGLDTIRMLYWFSFVVFCIAVALTML